MRKLYCSIFCYILTDEGIDGEAMSCLTENALQSLVTRIGPRMKLLKAIKRMQAHSTSSGSRSEDSTSSLVSSPSWGEDASESCADELDPSTSHSR